MKRLALHHPLVFSSLITLLQILAFGGAYRLFQAFDSTLGSSSLWQAWDVLRPWYDVLCGIAYTLVAVFLIARFGWRRQSGLTAPSQWRHLRVYVIPSILTCFTLLPLLHPYPLDLLVPGLVSGVFTVSFLSPLMAGVYEELLNRGIVQTALSAYGALTAIVFSAMLFGLMHLSHLVAGSASLFETARYVFRATAWGFGAAVLKVHTNTIVPLMALHGIVDYFKETVANAYKFYASQATPWSWVAQFHPVVQLVIYELPFYLFGVYGLCLLLRDSRARRHAAVQGNAAT